MAAQQIPSGDPGLRSRIRLASAGLLDRTALFRAKSPAKRRDLRRNGPVGVQFPQTFPLPARSRGMSSADTRHIPVLGRQAVEMLSPRDGGVYVDATFGAGGYSGAILDIAGTRVIGIDRDRTAIAGGFELVDRSDGRLTLVEDRFSNLAEVCAAQGVPSVDGVVMDVGVSSMQLDQPERGFSFRQGGPLDMRMGHDGPTAADVIAVASEADLAKIIYIFGEERYSRAVAKAIVAARAGSPDHDHARAGRDRLQSGVGKARRDSSGHPHLPGAADIRQPGARRTASGAVGRGAGAETGRPAGGGVVSFAGRPHRQEFFRSSAARPAAARGICPR